VSTIRDVARTAKVSVATVSHVLNRTRHVSAETTARVAQAITDVGYVHNSLARSLRTGQSDAIGMISSTLRNPIFIGLPQTIESLTAGLGYTVLQTDHHDQADLEMRAVEKLLSWRVDALVIQPSLAPVPVLEHLRHRQLPVVLIDRKPPASLHDAFDFVGTENVDAARGLVQHLLQHDHRRIAMVCGELSSSTMAERATGYRMALEQVGAQDPDLVRSVPAGIDEAADATAELMQGRHPPTAIFAASDQTCLGVLYGLRRLGLKVPHDVALVAFDDIPWAVGFDPSLTCAQQQVQVIGQVAANLIMQRLTSAETGPRAHQCVPTTFVRRESCGCTPHTAMTALVRHPVGRP
jgi:LacI family transcriptional regulator